MFNPMTERCKSSVDIFNCITGFLALSISMRNALIRRASDNMTPSCWKYLCCEGNTLYSIPDFAYLCGQLLATPYHLLMRLNIDLITSAMVSVLSVLINFEIGVILTNELWSRNNKSQTANITASLIMMKLCIAMLILCFACVTCTSPTRNILVYDQFILLSEIMKKRNSQKLPVVANIVQYFGKNS